MRVLYCTDTYPPQINGVSVVTSLSVAGLAAKGWECAVVAPRYPDGKENGSGGAAMGTTIDVAVGLPSIPLPRYPEVRLALPNPGPVHRLVQRFKPDLIHCATEFTVGRVGQLAAARAKLPVVSSYHTNFARYAEAYGIAWLRDSVSAYLRRFHRRSRRVYTPSAVSREDVLRLGIPGVEVWGCGVDATLFHPSRRSAKTRSALELGDRFTFVYVGRLAPEKRPEQIVDAFRIACEMLPPDSIRLVMAGTGPCEEELRGLCVPGVTIVGFLDRGGALPELYASCDAFAFASVTETLGLVVLEAMASGLPVIAAPAGGVRDHLRDGVNGLAYPAGSAHAMAEVMVQLASDDNLARRLARGARLTAEELSWEREIARLDLSYRQICEVPLTRAVA
jgi:phosphatidylinositol alpha 1,6-mannosyltransferase